MKKYINASFSLIVLGIVFGLIFVGVLAFTNINKAYAQSSTPVCEVLNRDLTIGSTGADVAYLQTFLEKQGYPVMLPGVPKGYFGGRTQRAVATFQRDNGISEGYGISQVYGYVGPVTRAVINTKSCTNPGSNTSIQVDGISTSAEVEENSDATDKDDTGEYNMRFKITSIGTDDAFIYLSGKRKMSSSDNSIENGIHYVIKNSENIDITSGNAVASLRHISGGERNNNHVRINVGQEAIFELSVSYDPIATGYYSTFLRDVNFDKTNGEPRYNVVLNPSYDDHTETSTIMIRDSAPSAKITLTNPYGGEKLKIGEAYKIQWKSEGKIENIQIGLLDTRYSSEAGDRREQIIAYSIPNTGSFVWSVPSKIDTMDLSVTNDPVYRIIIHPWSNDAAASWNEKPFSIINATTTTITPKITSLNPTIGLVGTTVTIKGEGFATSTENSINFNNYSVGSTKSLDSRTLSFVVPANLSSCRKYICTDAYLPVEDGLYPVTVSNINGTSNPYSFYVGQGTSSTPVLAFTNVKTNKTSYAAGEQLYITWNAPNLLVASNPTLDILKNNMTTIVTTINSKDRGPGWLRWTIPSNMAGGGPYQIQVTTDGAGGIKDGHSNLFNVAATAPLQPSLIIEHPNGGEKIVSDQMKPIFWKAINAPIRSTISLGYRPTDGSIADQMYPIASNLNPNNGYYDWKVPNVFNSTNSGTFTVFAFLQRQEDGYSVASDSSDKPFTIYKNSSVGAPPTVTSITPIQGGADTLLTIKGTGFTPNNTKVGFYEDAAESFSMTAKSVSDDGKSLQVLLSSVMVANTTPGIYIVRVNTPNGTSVVNNEGVRFKVLPYAPPVAITSAPTAELKVNGTKEIYVKGGDKINYIWNSKNGTAFSSNYTNSCKPGVVSDWVAASASGTISGIVSSKFSGCTLVVTYNVVGKKEIASDFVTIQVANISPINTLLPIKIPAKMPGITPVTTIQAEISRLITENPNYAAVSDIRETLVNLFQQLQEINGR